MKREYGQFLKLKCVKAGTDFRESLPFRAKIIINRSVLLGEGPGVFLEHLGLLIGSVLVLEAEEGSASSKIHLLDLISGLGSTESHEGVNIHVVSGGEEGEEVVVTESVDEIPVPGVLTSKDLGESLG